MASAYNLDCMALLPSSIRDIIKQVKLSAKQVSMSDEESKTIRVQRETRLRWSIKTRATKFKFSNAPTKISVHIYDRTLENGLPCP